MLYTYLFKKSGIVNRLMKHKTPLVYDRHLHFINFKMLVFIYLFTQYCIQ